MGSLGVCFQELREATLQAVEAMGRERKGGEGRSFVWGGVDLALKLTSDMAWAPLPQLLDPLFSRWFRGWAHFWRTRTTPPSPELTPPSEVMARLRLAENELFRMAARASPLARGDASWASKGVRAERAAAMLQLHTRKAGGYETGGATQAEKRRTSNMEMLLYGKRGVHLHQLRKLHEHLVTLPSTRSVVFVQAMWRTHLRRRLRRAREVKATSHEDSSTCTVDSSIATRAMLKQREESTQVLKMASTAHQANSFFSPVHLDASGSGPPRQSEASETDDSHAQPGRAKRAAAEYIQKEREHQGSCVCARPRERLAHRVLGNEVARWLGTEMAEMLESRADLHCAESIEAPATASATAEATVELSTHTMGGSKHSIKKLTLLAAADAVHELYQQTGLTISYATVKGYEDESYDQPPVG
ncbi:MAG: hypothetical protein SGPRY_001812 [Prymnesium sp.]